MNLRIISKRQIVQAGLFLLIAMQCAIGLAAPIPASDPIGSVKLSLGTVTATASDGTLIQLKRGVDIFAGYSITTGDRSFVRIEMVEGTRFTLGKNATASIDEFEFDEAAKTGKFTASVTRGGFKYKSGKIGLMDPGGRRHSTIKTPTASIGIRGSIVEGNVDASGNTLILLVSGNFEVRNADGTFPVTVDGNGNVVEIVGSGTPKQFGKASKEQLVKIKENLPTTEEENAAGSTTGSDAKESTEVDIGKLGAGGPVASPSGEQEI